MLLNSNLRLFDHWERHQWSIRDYEPAQDRTGWRALPSLARKQLRSNMIEFFIGEFSVTETLAPLVHAAGDKDAQLFLCTQLSDEARHSLFFYRYLEMVDGTGDSPESKLRAAWREAPDGQVELFDRQLRDLTERVRSDPSDLAGWVQAITLYHLVLEGVLATSGQRVMLQLVTHFKNLTVLTAALRKVSLDESRHVAFGVEVLRKAMADGYTGDVLDVIKGSIVPLVGMVVRPDREMPTPTQPSTIMYTLYGWEVARRALEKRLRAIGLLDYAAEVNAAWCQSFMTALDGYEATHGAPHPAREQWHENTWH